MKRLFLIIIIFCGLWSPICAHAVNYQALIITSYGQITVKLNNDTPLHRDNFVKLAREGFYDSLLFHRVISEFVIQAGDPASRHAAPGEKLGQGDPEYTLPSEIIPTRYHKIGVLAAARQDDEANPTRRSSGSQFYITVAVVGRLNGLYTIFGEVIDGQKVADKISRAPRDENDRPKKDVRIKTIKIIEK
ncbi:MAG: peptidylprolyl isomerase [Mucinivorans sp.]